MKFVPSTVSVKAGPPWVALDGESDVAVGLGFVEKSCTVCVPAESTMLSVAVRTPSACGVNFTVIVHSQPALRLDPQFDDAVNSLALLK